MHNIATIYRFNTPFLDLEAEKNNLISVIRKIKKCLELEWIRYIKCEERILNYHKIILDLENKLWKIEFFYLINNIKEYYLPVFKLNIYLSLKFLANNETKRKTTLFLTNIFECFDWLNEREFLIDLDNTIYYKTWLFRKRFPDYDFSDIEIIRKVFEKKEGTTLIEDFIKRFSWKTFELTIERSKYYHKIHSTFLYFIYLIFLMHQNIEKTRKTKQNINNIDGLYEWHIDLMKKRLSYIEDLHLKTFEKYKNRLEMFFELF